MRKGLVWTALAFGISACGGETVDDAVQTTSAAVKPAAKLLTVSPTTVPYLGTVSVTLNDSKLTNNATAIALTRVTVGCFKPATYNAGALWFTGLCGDGLPPCSANGTYQTTVGPFYDYSSGATSPPPGYQTAYCGATLSEETSNTVLEYVPVSFNVTP
jgi:hypothetical protein